MSVVTLYVPTTAPAPLVAESLAAAKAMFAKLFGGYTVVKGEGGWFNEAGDLVEEPVYLVTSYTDKHIALYGRAVGELASMIARALAQECVAVVFDNDMVFYKP